MRIKLVFILVFLGHLFTPGAVMAQNSIDYPEYVIREGDSLGYLSDFFDVPVSEIISLNNISNPDLISPGQTIRIPGLDGISGTLEIVTPRLGELYFFLPIKYMTEEVTINRINRLISPTQVYPGTELIIPLVSASEPLIPIRVVAPQQTGLESAISARNNPYTLSLLNHVETINHLFEGSIIFTFSSQDLKPINLFAPSITDVTLQPLPLVQGSTEVIHVSSVAPIKLNGYLGDQELSFFSESSGDYYSLQGIHALAQPGLVDFSLTGIFEDGTTQTYTQKVLLTPGIFDEDPPLIVDPKLIDPSVTEPENEIVFSLVSNKNPSRYWSEIFSSPAVYQEYTSLFGTRRWYNDDPEVRFHSGVDFGGGLTLPIYAPAPGLVVFAGPLVVRGNAVFIDHGWGVFSGFFHQDTLNVKVGDMVETGQVIGTVGNTGRVNGAGDYYGAGAHLHWELWVNDVQVNPLDWLLREFP